MRLRQPNFWNISCIALTWMLFPEGKQNLSQNGGREEIRYSMKLDMEKMLTVTGELYNPRQNKRESIHRMGKGMRSIYMLSLLETYEVDNDANADIIIVETRKFFFTRNFRRFPEKSCTVFPSGIR